MKFSDLEKLEWSGEREMHDDALWVRASVSLWQSGKEIVVSPEHCPVGLSTCCCNRDYLHNQNYRCKYWDSKVICFGGEQWSECKYRGKARHYSFITGSVYVPPVTALDGSPFLGVTPIALSFSRPATLGDYLDKQAGVPTVGEEET